MEADFEEDKILLSKLFLNFNEFKTLTLTEHYSAILSFYKVDTLNSIFENVIIGFVFVFTLGKQPKDVLMDYLFCY